MSSHAVIANSLDLPSSSSPSAAAPASAQRRLPAGVLLTNDDGPPGRYAPFLLPFSRVLKRRLAALQPSDEASVTRIMVCVPSSQQSWVGKAVSRFTQVRAHLNFPTVPPACPPPPASLVTWPQPDIAYWATVDGSPCTTCNVALHSLAPFPVDLVVSGPNLGRNTGRSFILSSGTVGAALEAAFAGKRAVALSFAFFDRLSAFQPAAVDAACEVAVDVLLRLWEDWGDGVELYNVNLPLGCSRGVQVQQTHILLDHYGSVYEPSARPQTEADLIDSEPNIADRQQSASVGRQPQDSAEPLPGSALTPSPQPPLGAGSSSSSSPVSVSGAEVQPLSRTIPYRFNAAMFERSWEQLPDYAGSDYAVVRGGAVSVTAMRATLSEAAWTPSPWITQPQGAGAGGDRSASGKSSL